jgi:molybdopterin-dependent oxidoreductase alpha subunit
MNEQDAAARGPQSEPPAKVSPPKTHAAGLGAVTSSALHTLAQMNPLRGARVWLTVNQKQGFDCPGCAWPDPDDHRSRFEFCENGAKAIAEEATEKRIGAEFFARHSVAELATWSDRALGQAGRLTEPLALRPGATHYTKIAWAEALSLLADTLNALESPDHAAFYTSGRTSNEAAFLYQLFVRKFGTNNLPDCSNMCHESSGAALMETIGVGKGTVTLEEIEDSADAIFLFGQNPGTNHPRMLTSLQKAVRRGAKIVAINPLPEAGLLGFSHPQEIEGALGKATPLASLFLPVTINGDLALLKGLMKVILEAGAEDREFIEALTYGFDELRADIESTPWDEIVAGSGLSEKQIRQAGQIAIESRATICCWAMGLTQHENAVGTIQQVVNFLLLRGMIGKPGAGVCPVRGHSNVQGDRTMGIWEKMPESFLSALGAEFEFAPPRHEGFDTVQTIQAMQQGKVRVFLAMGGNFLSASPDTDATAHALRQTTLTAHISTKLNRSHLVHGTQALILPCLGRTELDRQQFVTVENSMGVVHASRGGLAPASPELLSEVAIVCRLARATLGEDWSAFESSYDAIRERIARVVPGFEDFNRRVRRPGGFYLPNAAKERQFHTPTGRANFTVHSLPVWDLPDDCLLLMTIRSHDQYNTTIYGNDDRYRGIHDGRRVVFLNAGDLKKRGLKTGDHVDLVSVYEDGERVAPRFLVVAYPIPPRCAAAYFPEANVLVPLHKTARKSGTPISKSIVIRLR